MKILHVNCNYIGTALHQNMIEQLGRLGIDNSVFAPTYDSKIAVIKPNDNVCVDECFNKWDRLWFYYKQKKIIQAVQKDYDVSSFDCIHAYTLFTDGNCAMRLSQKYGIPYVVAVRNTDVNSFLRLMPHLRDRGVQIMREAAAVCFLSESYRELVFSKYVPKKYQEQLLAKTHIIPNGVDDFWHENTMKGIAQAKCKHIKNHRINLVYAGRIDRNKNIPTILEATRQLNQRGWDAHLTIVGKIKDNSIKHLIDKSSNTEYIQHCDKNELIQVYRANDIFVMPSFTESFGLVYVEAMTQGLPVVYTKGQGFDKQFQEGEVGYHVDAGSYESVLEAILKIVERYCSICTDLPSKAEKYSWKIICNRYRDLYNSIV